MSKIATQYMSTTKVCLRKIINSDYFEDDTFIESKINECAFRVNKIVSLTYLFLKSYILFLYEHNKPFPLINVQLIRNIMNTITIKNNVSGRKPLIDNSTKSINNFYHDHFKKLLNKDDIVVRDHLKSILNYEEIDIVKNIKTNIKTHYFKRLRFVISVITGINNDIAVLDKTKKTDREKIRGLHMILTKIVTDIINVENNVFISEPIFHNLVIECKKFYIPLKKSFSKNSIPYDIEVNPIDYLLPTIELNRYLERMNFMILKETNDPTKLYGLFSILPLRRSLIPCHIYLDTTSLLDLFVTDNIGKLRSEVSKNRLKVWKKFFLIDKKVFRRKEYIFAGLVSTNGIDASIHFNKVDKKGNVMKIPFGHKNENIYNLPDVAESEIGPDEKFVYIDPGKNDLINAMTINPNYDTDFVTLGAQFNQDTVTYDKKCKLLKTKFSKTKNPQYKKELKILKESYDNETKLYHKKRNKIKYKYFRYTQKQRKREINGKKKKQQKNIFYEKKINGKTIQEIESILSYYDSNTIIFVEFNEYIKAKLKVNRVLEKEYIDKFFRIRRWGKYIKKRKSEDKMVNNFSRIMGSPDEVTVIVGDYSDTGFKGKEPSITKKIRLIFKRKGYRTLLIDEFRTSKICSNCGKELERLRVGETLLWKLLKCKFCGAIHNRDHNATKNMQKITEYLRTRKRRPKIFTRPKIFKKNPKDL